MISIKDLTVIYPAKPVNRIANRGINLELASKGLVVITGPNGSGKSTLFKVLSGQLLPTAGEIKINGKLLPANEVSNKLASLFAYAPQDIALDKSLSGAQLAKREKLSEKNLNKVIKAFEIGKYWDQQISTLSRKHRQLVHLALTLLTDKQYLLLDEPTKYLDEVAKANLQRLLLDLSKLRSILVATHDPKWSKVKARTLHLQDGKIVVWAGKKSVDEFGWHFAGQVLKPKSLKSMKKHKNITHAKDLNSFLEVIDKTTSKFRLFDPELDTFDEITPGEIYANQKIILPANLIPHATQRMKSLSGGEKGWSYLYLLLAAKPKQIFLLYPSLNLDYQNQVKLQRMVEELATAGSKITIFDIE
jgi:ABC-type multidrug transport system ATPase subunit